MKQIYTQLITAIQTLFNNDSKKVSPIVIPVEKDRKIRRF